jgi:hypothetical protein
MWYNIPMSWILRSPLHGLLSKSTVLLIIIGRKSGKKYTLPVNYVSDGETLWVTSQRGRTWWRNLLGGAPVAVVLAGKTRQAYGEAFVEESAVIEGLQQYLGKAPQAAPYFGMTVNVNGQPEPDGLARAARERVIIQIRLSEEK